MSVWPGRAVLVLRERSQHKAGTQAGGNGCRWEGPETTYEGKMFGFSVAVGPQLEHLPGDETTQRGSRHAGVPWRPVSRSVGIITANTDKLSFILTHPNRNETG